MAWLLSLLLFIAPTAPPVERFAPSTFRVKWAKNETLRKKQRRTLRIAFRAPIDWSQMRDQVTIRLRSMGSANGKYDPPTYTITLNRSVVAWMPRVAARDALHEMLHALDFTAFDTSDRDAIYILFHGELPEGHFDPLLWLWPAEGLFPYGHGHSWFDSQYREGIGEAFAEMGQAAFLDGNYLPYDHHTDPASLRSLLDDLGYVTDAPSP